MSCSDVQTIQAGNGTKTQFSFDFPYIFKSEIHVYFWNQVTKEYDEVLTTDATYPWQVTDANPTIVEFTGTAPPAPAVPTDPGETAVDNVKIRRVTAIDDIRALFNPGSAIRSDDLNKNFEQVRYAIQEANCQGVTEEVYQYLLDNYWDRFDNTLYAADAWRSDDATIATTAALDQRFQDEVNETFTKAELAAAGNVMPDDDVAIPTTGALNDYIDEVITNDIGTDGTGITVTDDGDGTITLGLAANSIDLDRIKNEDIVTYAEEVAGSPTWDSDSRIPTTYAASRRFDTLVQTSTPSGSDWPVGKTWIQNDSDRTVYIWDSTQWLPIASGGAFTTLPKVVYVDSINGDDALEAHRLSNPKKTIKAAIDQINADANGDGSVVIVAPGIYGEEFPIDIQKNDVSIIGTSLRNCIIHPAIPVADQAGYDVNVPEPNELSTMFRVNSGTYLANLTLTGMKASGARGGNSLDTDPTYGLPTNQGWNFAFYPGATIRKSPYIQNCTNFSDSQIDNVNFTPHTPGEGSAGDLDSAPTGGGILIDGSTPDSNSPLRSMVCDSYTHTALDGPGIFVTNNGYCQATSSYSFFGHYHMKTKNGGQANLAASTSDFGRHSLIADGRSTSAIFTAVTTASASSGATTFTIGAPVVGVSWHGSATRPQDNMLVDVNGVTYPVLSAVANGAGWDVTISRPDPTNLSNNLGLNGAVGAGAAVEFYLRSMIASSGHTMEYVGSGTNYLALPENGGVPDATKETVELNNGKIWAAITDHKGTFKVGGTFSVNQQNGFITFGSGSFAIPSLIVDLDINGNNLYDSTGDISLNGQVTVNSNKIVNVADPTAAQDASTKAYTDTKLPLAGGTMTGNIVMSGAQTVDGRDLSVDGAKLDGIAANATNYSNSDVDAHLNQSTAASGEVLSWNGSDYDWVTTAAGVTDINGLSDGYTDTSNTSVGLGTNALANDNDTTNYNTAVGYNAGYNITSGSGNLALGPDAGRSVTTNSHNSFAGMGSGYYVNGDGNTGFGFNALNGASGSTASYNTAVGYRPFYNITTGTNNTGVGYYSGYSLTTGAYNNCIGYQAGYGGTTGNYNNYVGMFAGRYSNGNYNVALGYQALQGVSGSTTGSNNTAINQNALTNLTTGSANVAIGNNTLYSATTGGYNVAIGPFAGYATTNQGDSVYIGYRAGINNNGYACTFVGVDSGYNVTSGSYNIAIGQEALRGATSSTAAFNISLGRQSLYNITSGARNTALGEGAGYYITTGNDNVLAGKWSGQDLTTGYYNAFFGQQSGDNITTGAYNTCIGPQAGTSLTTGNYNTVIGYGATGSAGLSGTLILAANNAERIRVNSSGNMGIAETSPAARLDVNGNYASKIDSTASSTIDCSSSNYFTRTAAANTTYTFSSVPASRSYSFTLELTHTSGTITWPTSVKWPADTAPTLTTGKTHLFVFVTDDGGTRWRGAALVDYVN